MPQTVDNTYLYRGQGQVYIAEKHATTGNPLGFEFVGNVSELKLMPKTQAIEHTESQTGNNSVDARIERELKVDIQYQTCSAYKENLKRLLYGKLTETAASTISDEELTAYLGKSGFLDLINLDTFTSLTGTGGTPTYAEGTDYTIDLPTGRIDFLEGASFANGDPVFANYSSLGEEAVAAFEDINKYFWLRFSGLNSAVNNEPAVIDVVKIRFDPVTEFAAINNDDFNKFEQNGACIFDPTRPVTGKLSRYFTVRK